MNLRHHLNHHLFWFGYGIFDKLDFWALFSLKDGKETSKLHLSQAGTAIATSYPATVTCNFLLYSGVCELGKDAGRSERKGQDGDRDRGWGCSSYTTTTTTSTTTTADQSRWRNREKKKITV